MKNPGIEILVEAGDWPARVKLRKLASKVVEAALQAISEGQAGAGGAPSPISRGEEAAEISILFTDDAGIRRLSKDFRGKDKPTNVLSFPQVSGPLLGDIVLGFETVRGEAALAQRPLEAHIAHLIVHAFLHLIGYDHRGGDDAEAMEDLERAALKRIGIADPYAAAQEQ